MDTQGDAFFYAFPTGSGALEAAREGQEALLSGPIRVRIGVHTGTPHVTGEGYVGPDVNKEPASARRDMAARCCFRRRLANSFGLT